MHILLKYVYILYDSSCGWNIFIYMENHLFAASQNVFDIWSKLCSLGSWHFLQTNYETSTRPETWDLRPEMRADQTSMEQNLFWEAYSHSYSPEIFCLLWNPNVHYSVNKSLSLISILSEMQPFYTFPPNNPNTNVVCISDVCCACYISSLSHPP